MADIYRIGVSMALTNNVSQVLRVIARDLLGIRGEVGATEAAMGRLKGAMIGVGAVVVGAAILDGMAKLVEHGEKLVHQQALLKEAGFSQIEVANATAAAWKASADVLGTSVTDNIALVGDLRNRLGDLPKALAALPQMAQIGVVLAAGTGQDPEKAGDQAARFLELRGSLVNPVTEKIDASQLSREARLVEAIAASTKFKVGPEQLLAFQTTARAAGASLTDQGLKNLVPLIQAAKSPSNVGTQLSSLEQQLLGGVMTKAGAEFFEKAGVLDERKVHEGKGGHLTIDKGAVTDADLLRTDPMTWISTTFREGLKKGFKDTTVDQQTADIMRSHLRNTVVGLLVESVRSEAAFKKDAGLIDTAEKVDQYDQAIKEDPTTKMRAFKDAWDNLMTSLGAPLVTPATNALLWVAKEVNQATAFFAAHPDGVRLIGEFTAGFAGLLVLGGSMKVMSVALGPFATGLRSLGASVALMGPASEAGAALKVLSAAGGIGSLAGFGFAIAGLAVTIAGLAWLTSLPSDTRFVGGSAGGSKGGGHFEKQNADGTWSPADAPKSAVQNWWDRFSDPNTPTGAARRNGNAQLDARTLQPLHITVYSVLDSKIVAKSTSQQMARSLTSNAGPTGGDTRAVPTPPGGNGQ